jgi:hypothetical protein
MLLYNYFVFYFVFLRTIYASDSSIGVLMISEVINLINEHPFKLFVKVLQYLISKQAQNLSLLFYVKLDTSIDIYGFNTGFYILILICISIIYTLLACL